MRKRHLKMTFRYFIIADEKILIIHTGGTISMKEDEETGAVHPDEKHPLYDATPSLASLGDIYVEELFHLPPAPYHTARNTAIT
jgi:L-asparaginase